jgi:peptide/nickel transport system permease protein
MRKYAIKRVLIGIPTVFGAALLIFIIMRVVPGDVAVLILIGGVEEEEQIREEDLQALRVQLGLDKPLPLQFLTWMTDIARWDLGNSLWSRQPITDLIARRFPLTIQLALMALLISWVVAIPVGVLSALKQDTPLDYVPRFISIIGLATPNFWLGILTMTYLAAIFGWIPPLTYQAPWVNLADNFTQLIFPALVLGVSGAAIQVRIMRAQMLEVLRDDYIRTAYSKGLGTRTVVRRHALKNALIPVITLGGAQLNGLLGGSLVTEVVFNLPGFGNSIVQAVRLRDYPVIQNLVFMIAVIYILVNLGVDLLYGWLDPRISYTDY